MIDSSKVFEICSDSYEIVQKIENVNGDVEIHCSYLDMNGNRCKEYIIIITDVITVKFYGNVSNMVFRNVIDFALWVDL